MPEQQPVPTPQAQPTDHAATRLAILVLSCFAAGMAFAGGIFALFDDRLSPATGQAANSCRVQEPGAPTMPDAEWGPAHAGEKEHFIITIDAQDQLRTRTWGNWVTIKPAPVAEKRLTKMEEEIKKSLKIEVEIKPSPAPGIPPKWLTVPPPPGLPAVPPPPGLPPTVPQMTQAPGIN